MRTRFDEEKFTFDPETNTLHLHHDWQGDEPVSTAIVMGVAAVTNTPPTELEPLYHVVNPDSLNRLYRPTSTNTRRQGGSYVKFRTNDCVVAVHSNGEIEITPSSEREE